MSVTRRNFIGSAAVASAVAVTGLPAEAQEAAAKTPATGGRRPILISSANGIHGIDGGYEMLRRGHDTLDAALYMGQVQEDDPTDDSVGLGGLPNEDGEVELDACCMHGPTRRAGSVGGVRRIKNVARLARTVMDHTGHVMLVGEGAQRFGVAQGFPLENLLTERSRKVWLLWKEAHSSQDWWGPGVSDPGWKPPPPLVERVARLEAIAASLGIDEAFRLLAVERVLFPPTGTIHVSALNEKGEISGMTTTSGLAWKLAGRLGDSPILGAGCWNDPDVGSAGATGSGEENIKVVGAHAIVENMRRGLSPQEAGLDALRRVAHNHGNDMERLRYVSMTYYVLRNDGAYAGVSLWDVSSTGERRRFAVHDGTKRLEDCVPLFHGTPGEWPPTPKLPT